MTLDEFLFQMYFNYGQVPELVKRYIDNNLDDYSEINQEELGIKIECNN